MAQRSPFPGEITERLRELNRHHGSKADSGLFTVVYDELRRQAHRHLRRERPGHTLQTTALVHETYLKLSKQKGVEWENRSHFFAVAATMMRRILIDHAKAKHRARRGGVQDDRPLDEALSVIASNTAFDVIALDEALDRLTVTDRQVSRVVELRFFAGLDVSETAQVLGVSDSTVKRDWRMAKAWLHRELTK